VIVTLAFNPLDRPDAEVFRAYFCQITGRSKITAYRLEHIDPLWVMLAIRRERMSTKRST
jgi:hypothetical protein